MSIEVMKQALDALGAYMEATDSEQDEKAHNLMATVFFKLKEAIEQSEKQEPVAFKDKDGNLLMTIDASEPIGYVYSIHGERTKTAVIDSRVPNGKPLYTTPQPQRKWVGTVDCIGLALDLEAQAKRVESQTVERAMLAAANGLRIIDKESKA